LGYLSRINEATHRMDKLIEEIMNLARVAQVPLAHSEIRLEQIAGEVMEALRASEPRRRLEWRAMPCEPVRADAVLLRDVLENLISNAWKFTGLREVARIEFGCETGEGGEKVYFLRDNGVGFDSALAAKLFRPFERLHHQDEFPGTGLGLASVERIIARHGGRIWAEGAPDEGAVFRFTLGTQEV
jgi:light-regulated signal transduction histidine kinase (bacteriophytochrome)